MKSRARPARLCVLLLPVACQSAPQPTSGGPSATGSAPGPGSAAASAQVIASASPTAPAAGSCAELRRAVVSEAGKLAPCETDADCKVHRVVLCDFDELDCHAAHVHNGRSTSELDQAVSAYARACDVSKCRCDVPSKSVCTKGKCAAK